MSQTARKRHPVLFYLSFTIVFLILLFMILICQCNWIAYLVLFLSATALCLIRHTTCWKGFSAALCWILSILLTLTVIPFTNTVSFGGGLVVAYRRYVYTPGCSARDPQTPVKKSADIWEDRDGYQVEQFTYDNMDMKLLQPDNSNGRVILQFHGGAYVYPLNTKFENYAIEYSKINGNSDVLTFDYRVAPENPYPAALEDALHAYFWLLDNGYQPEDILFVGDSAGGGLALATTMYLRDHELPMPKGIITLSAWTNLAFNGESVETNKNSDPQFYEGSPLEGDLIDSTYIGDNSAQNPYISPVYGDFTGFPPMLMQAGGAERLLSDTTDVAQKAKDDGVDVQETIYSGMFHEFQIIAPNIRESKQAYREMEQFVSQLYQE